MQVTIKQVCEELTEFLLAKNKAYGDSASNPVRIFSKTDPLEQINIRIDDKLSRIARGNEFDGDDTELDLIGYLVLKRAIKRKNAEEWAQDADVYAGRPNAEEETLRRETPSDANTNRQDELDWHRDRVRTPSQWIADNWGTVSAEDFFDPSLSEEALKKKYAPKAVPAVDTIRVPEHEWLFPTLDDPLSQRTCYEKYMKLREELAAMRKKAEEETLSRDPSAWSVLVCAECGTPVSDRCKHILSASGVMITKNVFDKILRRETPGRSDYQTVKPVEKKYEPPPCRHTHVRDISPEANNGYTHQCKDCGEVLIPYD